MPYSGTSSVPPFMTTEPLDPVTIPSESVLPTLLTLSRPPPTVSSSVSLPPEITLNARLSTWTVHPFRSSVTETPSTRPVVMVVFASTLTVWPSLAAASASLSVGYSTPSMLATTPPARSETSSSRESMVACCSVVRTVGTGSSCAYATDGKKVAVDSAVANTRIAVVHFFVPILIPTSFLLGSDFSFVNDAIGAIASPGAFIVQFQHLSMGQNIARMTKGAADCFTPVAPLIPSSVCKTSHSLTR